MSLTDAQWARIEPLLPDRTPRRGGRWRDHRQVIDAIAFRFRTGTPWMDLPEHFGSWKGAHDRLRQWAADGRPTGLGEAFVRYGRIFKTLHLLQFLHDEGYRRMIGTQLNVQEARHRLARKIAFGSRGQLRRRYREGMEDQLGSLGLALNAVIWWNSLYLDAAVQRLRAQGFPVTDEMCARLSPIAYEHINFLGRYAFTRADVGSGLRPFHDVPAPAG
ncbi:Tn3 family transposase [Streptosporangium sandarakinum]|uniref:Tn3 family transposase n=1 Tax=Streptosporangium sandarakinum TaxID=1260955 RepID=UPI003D924099